MSIIGDIKAALGGAVKLSPPSPQLLASIESKKTQLRSVDQQLSKLGGWNPSDKAARKQLEGQRSQIINDLTKDLTQAYGSLRATGMIAPYNIRG